MNRAKDTILHYMIREQILSPKKRFGYNEISSETGVSLLTVYKYIREFKRCGIIDQTNKSKKSHQKFIVLPKYCSRETLQFMEVYRQVGV